MAKRVLLEAGHWPDRGGAPGEAAWTWDLAIRIASLLEAAGVKVQLQGSWYPGVVVPDAVREDYDLYVSLHYDATSADGRHTSGCFFDRAKLDPVGGESDRFGLIWERRYHGALGIPLTVYRRNPNTWDYYGFRGTSARTPGVILEHGCGSRVAVGAFPAGADAAVLWERIAEVARADGEAILEFLGLPAPPVVDPCAELRADREYNYALKQVFEARLRQLVPPAEVEALIASVPR